MSYAAPPLNGSSHNNWEQSRNGTKSRSKGRTRAHRVDRLQHAGTQLQEGHRVEEIHNMKVNLGATTTHSDRERNLPSPRARSPIEREAYSSRRSRDRSSSRQGGGNRRRHKHHPQNANHTDSQQGVGGTQLPQLVSAQSAGGKHHRSNGHGHNSRSVDGPGASSHEDHLHASASSLRGLKPGNPNWINQDNYVVIEQFDAREIYMYCVLDGHGEFGHLVSRRCRETFQQQIRSCNMDIKRAFNVIQNDLSSCDIDSRCSGATCVLVALYNGSERGQGNAPGGARLVAYNCGDSRAVLGRRNSSGAFVAMALTNDHKPEKPEERKRILGCGGHLGCRQVMVNQPGRGPVSVPVGPCRVWYQYRGDTLGLAMSRSLGDTIVHRSGVSAEPEILEHYVEENDEFVIIATDGIWDVVDSNQAVQLIQNFWAKNSNWNTAEAASWLCKFARSRWEKMAPMIDDITCVIIRLNAFKDPALSVRDSFNKRT